MKPKGMLRRITTVASFDSNPGDEVVIFRSGPPRSKKGYHKIEKDVQIQISRKGKIVAHGVAVKNAEVVEFCTIPESDFSDSYSKDNRTKDCMLECLRKMYETSGYDENTRTTVIRMKVLSTAI